LQNITAYAMVTDEIKLLLNNFEIISVFYFTWCYEDAIVRSQAWLGSRPSHFI